MGCGNSKEAVNEPIPLEPARVATARPPTSQDRPASRRPPSSQRPSSSKRPSSSSRRPSSSSRRTGSAQGERTRPKSSYQGQPTIYEDHTPGTTTSLTGAECYAGDDASFCSANHRQWLFYSGSYTKYEILFSAVITEHRFQLYPSKRLPVTLYPQLHPQAYYLVAPPAAILNN